ncbi:MAG: hypothetical protein HY302_00365 [Opitutae bacterium]|nr:hypothetical protein [Opitutae bacterium]
MAADPQPKRLVYFILATPGSGRREIVRDLVENGLADGERALVLVPDTDAANPVDARLAALANAEVRRWTWASPDLPATELPAGATVFFLSDARADPITQLEALKPWLERHGAELARIFCVVDCQLAERQPVLAPWFEACIHFSDVVFLTKRTGVANKWMSDFVKHFKEESFPCHFIHVKKGAIPNPALALDPTPRRISQYFDYGESLLDVEIETDGDEDDEDEGDMDPPLDSYFVRNTAGRRERELPEISKYLDAD